MCAITYIACTRVTKTSTAYLQIVYIEECKLGLASNVQSGEVLLHNKNDIKCN